MEFPTQRLDSPTRYYRRLPHSAEAGRIVKRPLSARWTAETHNGQKVELYGLDERLSRKSSVDGSDSRIAGRAWSAVVELPKESPLAFWNATPEGPRTFFLGFGSYSWTTTEDVCFPSGNGTTETWRRSILLSTSPERQIYEAGFRVNLEDGAWLYYGSGHAENARTAIPLPVERGFVSLLLGCRTSFFWRDEFLSKETLRRTYFGTERVTLERLKSVLSPLPFRGSKESLRFAKEVVEHIPALFDSYLRVNPHFDLAFILAPLWSAPNGLLTENLALACVSLERLASAWQVGLRVGGAKREFWSKTQRDKVCDTLKDRLKAIAADVSLTPTQVSVLEKRLDQLGAVPNADRLVEVFKALELPLSEFEREVVNDRNKALHGRPTLDRSRESPNYDAEVLRFDTLRMIVMKAVLGLLQYRGPFINYAARGPQTDFPVEFLQSSLGVTAHDD